MIFLNDTSVRENLFPFTLTRHAADIRIGILTIKQKWELLLGEKVYDQPSNNALDVPANIIPTKENYQTILAFISEGKEIIETPTIKICTYPWHITQLNEYAIKQDFLLLTSNKILKPISNTNKLINAEQIFIEEGVVIEHCILNGNSGPIYIDKDSSIQEGSMIRGPFYLGKNALVKMGTKIYGATSIGNNCVIGGEIKNSTILDNSNKAHDGYLGDSVIGSWCNLGAGTSNSNLKNTLGNVEIQLSANSPKLNTGMKAGLFMGDYSKAAINTSFNTGTVVGVCCNIFGEQNLPKFIDSFTWGNELYDFEKAITHIQNWMALKKMVISKNEIDTLEHLYSQKINQ